MESMSTANAADGCFSFQFVSLRFLGLGAAYGTAKAGVGVCSMGVARPELVMKVRDSGTSLKTHFSFSKHESQGYTVHTTPTHSLTRSRHAQKSNLVHYSLHYGWCYRYDPKNAFGKVQTFFCPDLTSKTTLQTSPTAL